MIERKTLFNPGGNDALSDRFLTKGNPTNLLNFSNTKYTWAWNLGKQMINNNWEPDRVDLTKDKVSYNSLIEVEKDTYDSILSFLVFLDSLQTQNVPRIAESIKAPEIVSLLSTHAYQENIHALSYQWLIENVIPIEKREGIYDRWREDDVLFERNKKIASIFDSYWTKYLCNSVFGMFSKSKALNKLVNKLNLTSLFKKIEKKFTLTNEDLLKVFLATYVLEGIYFHNGFIFFWNLASQQKMSGTSDMITYIAKDEKTHCVAFGNLINDFRKEVDLPNFEAIAYEIFDLGVQQEILWSNYLFRNNRILGINEESIDIKTKHLANSWLRHIGLKPLYTEEKYKKDPYYHLAGFASSNAKEQEEIMPMKPNYFEATVTEYQKATSVEDWNEDEW